MIREYALDPELMSSWDRLRLFTGQFGFGAGRLISEYPRIWGGLVLAHINRLNLPDMEHKRMVVKLTSVEFTRKLIKREGAGFNPNKPWLENTAKEHVRQRFDAIIACSNPDANADVLLGDELDPDDPRWRASVTCKIRRTADDIARVAHRLVVNSREILLIDPYFRPDDPSHVKPLLAILNLINVGRVSRVEYHFSDKGIVDLPELWRTCNDRLARRLPLGMNLRLVLWPASSEFHNRFILTEAGGMQFGHGLSEAPRGSVMEDDVSLLDETHRAKCWAEFESTAMRKPRATYDVDCRPRR